MKKGGTVLNPNIKKGYQGLLSKKGGRSGAVCGARLGRWGTINRKDPITVFSRTEIGVPIQ